jgi:hypothetical protein
MRTIARDSTAEQVRVAPCRAKARRAEGRGRSRLGRLRWREGPFFSARWESGRPSAKLEQHRLSSYGGDHGRLPRDWKLCALPGLKNYVESVCAYPCRSRKHPHAPSGKRDAQGFRSIQHEAERALPDARRVSLGVSKKKGHFGCAHFRSPAFTLNRPRPVPAPRAGTPFAWKARCSCPT